MKQLLNSKTFAFLLLLFVVATVLLVIGKLGADLWVELVSWLIGAGAVRGTGEHIQTFKRKKENEILDDLRTRSDDELRGRVLDASSGPYC